MNPLLTLESMLMLSSALIKVIMSVIALIVPSNSIAKASVEASLKYTSSKTRDSPPDVSIPDGPIVALPGLDKVTPFPI